MRLTVDDTIAALASAPGASPRGVIRVTGPGTRSVVRRVFCPEDGQRWETGQTPRRFTGTVACRLLEDVEIPAATYLWPTSRSFTGQPSAELHLWGAPVVLQAVLQALYEAGARPAQPGEFTLRAFLAGRIDLIQAEAVLGVIDANEQEQLRAALNQLAGGLSGELAIVRSELLDLLADIEAGLDFVEEDIEFVSAAEIERRLRDADARLERLLERARERLDYSGHFRVVLAGLPNAGKSTLFNALAGDSVALVSDRQGTTTDYLTARVEWDGVPIELVDTAGWEDLLEGETPAWTRRAEVVAGAGATSRPIAPAFAAAAERRSCGAEPSHGAEDAGRNCDPAEAHAAAESVVVKSLAQQQRERQIGRADLILWCTPCDADPAACERDRAVLERVRLADWRVVRVATKSDLLPDRGGSHAAQSEPVPGSDDGQRLQPIGAGRAVGQADLQVACRDDRTEGLEQLKAWILDRLASRDGGRGEIVGTTAARSRESLRAAREALSRAIGLVAADSTGSEPDDFESVGAGAELLAVEIRAALDELGRILGIVYTDDILDRIFSKFCIGK